MNVAYLACGGWIASAVASASMWKVQTGAARRPPLPSGGKTRARRPERVN